jgi:hypothetical protein
VHIGPASTNYSQSSVLIGLSVKIKGWHDVSIVFICILTTLYPSQSGRWWKTKSFDYLGNLAFNQKLVFVKYSVTPKVKYTFW